MLNWLKIVPTWVWTGLGVLVLCCGSFMVGRYAVPPKVIVQTQYKEIEKQVVVVQTKTEVQVVKVADTAKIEKLHRIITELQKPDGTHEKRVEEDINVDTVVHTTENKTEIQYVDRVIEKEKIVMQDKIVEKGADKPGWRADLGVGASIPTLLGQPEQGIPGLKGLVIQGSVGRRVAGPFFVTLWGNTMGVVGMGIGGEF